MGVRSPTRTVLDWTDGIRGGIVQRLPVSGLPELDGGVRPGLPRALKKWGGAAFRSESREISELTAVTVASDRTRVSNRPFSTFFGPGVIPQNSRGERGQLLRGY